MTIIETYYIQYSCYKQQSSFFLLCCLISAVIYYILRTLSPSSFTVFLAFLMSLARSLLRHCALLALVPLVSAVLQTAQVDVYLGDASTAHSSPSYSLLASQASFGSYPAMLGITAAGQDNPTMVLARTPQDNALLCQNVTASQSTLPQNTVLMVPRGTCTFQTKAYNAQQLGAKAIMIYGNLASRYALNETNATNTADTQITLWPQAYYDYDCAMGRALLPTSLLSFVPPPYNSQVNDPILTGRANECSSNANCVSQACLLTGTTTNTTTTPNNNNKDPMMEACCAWDLHIWLYADDTADYDDISIPAVYISMQQAKELMTDMTSYSTIQIIISERWRPAYNISSYIIWALGVAVAAVAAYLSATEYHQCIQHYLEQQRARLSSASRRSTSTSTDPRPRPPVANPEESLELTAEHALAFIVMASSSLMILFYFKIYGVVKFMYAMGCSKAVSQVLFTPAITIIMRQFQMRNLIVWRTGTEEFGDITLLDVIAHVMGYTLGLAWLIISFTVRHPDTMAFYWITQDIFGACMCVMFLQTIKLNSMRVAAILLLVAFFYDIFFVFVTPLIFKGKSVMITVATSGGPPKADPSWCEKYPDDANCQGGDPLPMLFTIPRINDYQGGSSLLGLGDIVLPGLLISFGARLDAAKSLLGVMNGGNGSIHSYAACPERKFCWNCSMCSGGYFVPLVIAYAVGLSMANAAVYLMQMGQPALLYLVPCTLGTLSFMGWRRQELQDLWDGPRAIRAADNIVYGEETHGGTGVESSSLSGHAPLPTCDDDDDSGLETPIVPSAEDDDDDVER